ncbi:hypothetical protein GGR50DRAFT_537507 [Xylaria sp. CBS 124048]|nr:hypothetical protein GGR50DRAFT_537507 [Xylaria sp. CBS 124048]
MTVMKPRVCSTEACCTCATPLTEVPRLGDSGKQFPPDRWLECCPRTICGRCIYNNHRFKSYCPYCQISQADNLLPPGLKDPPPYTASADTNETSKLAPPPYTPNPTYQEQGARNEKSSAPDEEQPEDILHFLDHTQDSINSLSLRYGVPAAVLRRANNIGSDHLLAGRRTIIIPGQYCKGGVSLSPRPIEGEEEEVRKAKIRRWMVGCKVHDYDVALLYLEQAGYDLQLATDTYFADEEWEQKYPRIAAKKGKGILERGVNGFRLNTRR